MSDCHPVHGSCCLPSGHQGQHESDPTRAALRARVAALEAEVADLRAQLAAAQADFETVEKMRQDTAQRLEECARQHQAAQADLAEAARHVEDLLVAVYAWSDGRDGRFPAEEAAEAWLAARGGK